MRDTFLPFAKPSINDAAINEVVACLKSGWITTGPRVKQFETMLADYLSAPHVLALSTATAGLHLALLGLHLQPGDEVITPAFTFVATFNMIVRAGGTPVLVDIDPRTRNMDVTRIEKVISKKTRAIMPVHFAGLSVDLDPIYNLAKQYHLRVIEDAAQAIGSGYKGKRIGSFGDTQVFSFHPNKNMTTGEGGCVATRDEALAKEISVLRFHGIDRDAFNRFSKTGSQLYDVIEPGLKYNMMDMQAALGIHQLPLLDSFNAKRTALAMRYQDKLKLCAGLSLPTLPAYACTHSWHLYTVLIDPHYLTRDAFIDEMKARNIGVGLHYQPTHLYTFYQQQFGFKVGDFPHTEDVGNRIVSLPLYPDLTEKDQDDVIEAIYDILRTRA